MRIRAENEGVGGHCSARRDVKNTSDKLLVLCPAGRMPI
jgi:hypothetical protein